MKITLDVDVDREHDDYLVASLDGHAILEVVDAAAGAAVGA